MKSSLKLVGAAAVLALSSASAQAQLIISEVVDGTLSGGQPKFVEISNTSGAPIDMSLYKIVHYNNGTPTPLGNVLLAPAGMLAAGDSWVVTYGVVPNTQFVTVYGFPPDQEVSFGGHNGDDAVALEFVAGGIVDLFGDIGCDPIATSNPCGTPPTLNACPSSPWDYEDGYVYRCGVTSSAVFVPSDWIIGGSESLEDCLGDPGRIALMLALTTPGVKQGCTPAPTVYCTAKPNSLNGGPTCPNGIPSIGFTGSSSATAASGFTIASINIINNKVGILIYKNSTGGSAMGAQPFAGGLLCLASGLGPNRVPAVNSGGSPAPTNDCSGVYSVDMNAFAQGLIPGPPLPQAYLLTAGQEVVAQYWGRDPGFAPPNNVQLTNALIWIIGP